MNQKVEVRNPVDEIVEALNILDGLRASIGLLNQEHEDMRQAAIPVEVKVKLSEIDAEYAPKLKALLDKEVAQLKDVITKVMKFGVSVKGDHLMAVYSEGRLSWDGKQLAGFFQTMPQLAEKFSKRGKPTVTIRKMH